MQDLWQRVAGEYALEAHHFTILEVAARTYDRWQSARRTLDEEGLTTLTKTGQPRPHPAARIEQDSRIAYLRALRELGLDDE